MLHAYDQKFDVTKNLENFCELNKALYHIPKVVGKTCVKVPSWAWAFACRRIPPPDVAERAHPRNSPLRHGWGGVAPPFQGPQTERPPPPSLSSLTFSPSSSPSLPPPISGATEACRGGGLSRAASPRWPRPAAAAAVRPRRRGSCPPRRPPLALASWGGTTCPSPLRFGARSTPPFPSRTLPSATGALLDGAGWRLSCQAPPAMCLR